MTTTTLPTELTADIWAVDPSHSEAGFTVRHAGTSKVRGNIAITEATITIGVDPWASAVTATLDAASIDTRDAGRDGHVKGADFFDVENFLLWTFVSTSVTGSGREGVVTGDLTIRGVTREVRLATLRAGFAAFTEISRKDFGLTFAHEGGGVLLGDKVKINLQLAATKQV